MTKCRSLGNETDLRSCHDLPQLVACTISRRRDEPIGNNNAFDHVGEDRLTWPALHPNRHHRIATRRPAPNTSIDADEPRWTPKARPDQPSRCGSTGEGPGRVGEFDGGRELHGHHLSEGVLQSSTDLDVSASGRQRTRSAQDGSVTGGASGSAPGPRYTRIFAMPTPATGGASDIGKIATSASS